VPGLFPKIRRRWPDYNRAARPTLHYWMETEVHVFSFSIAANVLLSFWPFLLVMMWLFRYVFPWEGAQQAIFLALRDTFAGDTGRFLVSNLDAKVYQTYITGGLSWFSMLLLLFTANGIFLPLEVALNRAWGVAHNRSFWKNQVISMALIFACGMLLLFSIAIPAWGAQKLQGWFGDGTMVDFAARAFFKLVSVPITIAVLFLIYWILPNRKVPVRLILPGAVVVGLALEVLRWINLLISPWLQRKLEHEYYPFNNSATILLWSFFAGMVMLAGAEWAARTARALELDSENRDRISGRSTPPSSPSSVTSTV
jgi:uncharacterized BrkB/YihY/UPF0761 family membrane protein